MPLPPWVTTLVSLLLGLVALGVILWADIAQVALSTGAAAILGGLAGGLAGWQVPSPYDKPKLPPAT